MPLMTVLAGECEAAIATLEADPALAGLLGPDAMSLVWARSGERLLWASDAARDLSRALVGEAGQGAPGRALRTRLRWLGEALGACNEVRLERLRLRTDPTEPPALLACRLITVGQTEALLTIVVDPQAGSRPLPRDAPAGFAALAAGPVASHGSASAAESASTAMSVQTSPLRPSPAYSVMPFFEVAFQASLTSFATLMSMFQVASPSARTAPAPRAAKEADRPGSAEDSPAAGPTATALVAAPAHAQVESVPTPPEAEPGIVLAVTGTHGGAGPGERVSHELDLGTFAPLQARVGGQLGIARPVPLRVAPDRRAPEAAPRPRLVHDAEQLDRADPREPDETRPGLSSAERGALQEIARALGARVEGAHEREAESADPDGPGGLDPGRPHPPAQPDATDGFDRDILAAALHLGTSGLVLLDASGRIVALDSRAERLFGYEPHEVVGEALALLLAPESHAAAFVAIEAVRNGKAEGSPCSLIGRRRGGELLPLTLSAGRLASGAASTCIVFQDDTRARQAEHALVRARKAAELANRRTPEFLARVSHEVRTPLNAIIGFADVMIQERFGPVGTERYRSYLGDIRDSGVQVMTLLDGLFDLATAMSGKVDLAPSALDLSEVVRQGVALLQARAVHDQVVIRTSFASGPALLLADEGCLRDVVLGLLSNAMRFTEAGGQVIASTAIMDGGDIAFRVRDTGGGLSEEEIEAILQPFDRIPGTWHDDDFALPRAKALIEANGGTFTLTSARHRGTLVEAMFPAVDGTATERARSQSDT